MYFHWKVLDETFYDYTAEGVKTELGILCLCTKCSVTKRVVHANSLALGKTKSCIECAYLEKGYYGCYKGIIGSVFNRFKTNAISRELEFDISLIYVGDLFEKQNGKCALSGLDLILKKRRGDINGTASLDRINSKFGYIEGNVQWIHKDINKMKNNYDESYFINICKLIAENSLLKQT